MLDEFGQRLANGGRGSEIRVPEAEIAYGVVAILLLELDAGFEHATDPGAVLMEELIWVLMMLMAAPCLMT